MRKIISIVKEDAELKDLCKLLESLPERYSAKAEFALKQLKKLKEECEEESQVLWRKIEDKLGEKKLYPDDYTKEKYGLSWDPDSEVIWIYTKDERGPNLGDLLKGLFDK